MPRSLTALQNYWTTLDHPPGARFDADAAIELAVENCIRYKQALAEIAHDPGKAGEIATEALRPLTKV